MSILRPWIGPVLAGAVLLVVLVGVGLQFTASATQTAELTVGDRMAPLSFALFAVVAGVVTGRRPDHAVGWLLLAFTAMMAAGGLGEALGHRLPDTAGMARDIVTWVQAWSWLPGLGILATTLLVFPDGHLPSPRWRPVLVIQLVSLAGAAAIAVTLWPYRGPALLPVEDDWPGPAGAIARVALPLLLLGFVGAVVSLVVRYRTAGTVVRLQLRWLLLAVTFLAIALVLAAVTDYLGLGGQWLQDVFGLAGLALTPVALGVAVLRYRLYEIDRIVSRTVAWSLVTLVLAAVYLTTVVALQAVLRPVLGDGDLPVALATLAVAAVARPVLGRVQSLVDRRFNRARYDAAVTVDAFGRGLRDEVSRDVVVADLLRTARYTFQPRSIGVLHRPLPDDRASP